MHYFSTISGSIYIERFFIHTEVNNNYLILSITRVKTGTTVMEARSSLELPPIPQMRTPVRESSPYSKVTTGEVLSTELCATE